jgi:hypothetical protein
MAESLADDKKRKLSEAEIIAKNLKSLNRTDAYILTFWENRPWLSL